jgi:MFS family permease
MHVYSSILRWRKSHDSSDPRPPPFLLNIRSSKIFIISTVSLAVFTDIFLYGLIVPVIPFALSTRVGVSSADVQRYVSILLAVYGGALLIASPICGWLADKSPSRRLPLLVGLLCLAGSTILLCLGSSVALLVTGRLLQGFSAAIVWTVGLALLVDTVGKDEVGQVMGSVFLAMSLAYLIAPLLGGIVYAQKGYYAVYYLAFGVIALDIILRFLLIEKKIAKQWLPAAEESPSTFSNPAPTPSPEGTRAFPSETTPLYGKPSSLPPVLTLLASRRLLTALWGCLVQAAILTAFDSVLPLRVEAIFQWSSTGAGLIFLPLVIPSFISPVVGMLADKYGPKYLAAAGFLLACPFLILLRLIDYNSIGQKVLFCALLALVGLWISVVMVPLMAEVSYVVEAKEKSAPGIFGERGAYAQAYALFNVAFAAGTLVGPIWGGFVNQKAGWGVLTLSLGLLTAVSSVPVAIWTGGPRRRRDREVMDGENVAQRTEKSQEKRRADVVE